MMTNSERQRRTEQRSSIARAHSTEHHRVINSWYPFCAMLEALFYAHINNAKDAAYARRRHAI